jgi:hypothetical protein
VRQAEAGRLSLRLAWSTLRPCLKKQTKKGSRREGRRYTFPLLQLLKKDIF